VCRRGGADLPGAYLFICHPALARARNRHEGTHRQGGNLFVLFPFITPQDDLGSAHDPRRTVSCANERLQLGSLCLTQMDRIFLWTTHDFSPWL